MPPKAEKPKAPAPPAGPKTEVFKAVEKELAEHKATVGSPAVGSPAVGSPADAGETKIAKAKRIAKEQADIIARLSAIEPTPSETASLIERFDAINVTYAPSSDDGRKEFNLDSGFNVEAVVDIDELHVKFADLDKKYTDLAVENWKLSVAYHQKREEFREYKARQTNTMEKFKEEKEVEIEVAKQEAEEASKKPRHKSCGCPDSNCASSGCGCRTHGQACDANCGCAKRNAKCGNPLSAPVEDRKAMIVQQKADRLAKVRARLAVKKAGTPAPAPAQA